MSLLFIKCLTFAVTPIAIALILQIEPTYAVDLDESREPPLQYMLHIDGKPIAIEENNDLVIKGHFADPNIKLVVEPVRVFPYRGVSFKYPRHFVFEAELEDQDAQIWTLSGNDFVIMYFDLNGDVSADWYATELLSQFGKENGKIVDRDIAVLLGKQKLKGTRMRVTVATHTMQMDVYRLGFNKDRTRLLVFQDSLDEKSKPSKEGTAALSLLKESFAK